jgi:hypothetical protein
VGTVPAEFVPWIREQRKAEFAALALRWRALEGREASLQRRFKAKGPDGMRDDDWALLEVTAKQRDSLEAEVLAFWEQPGFLPLEDFLVTTLDADAVAKVPEHEWPIHLRRPKGPPSRERPDAEWLDWLVPLSRAAVRVVRDAMASAPLTAEEIAEAVECYRGVNSTGGVGG